jgi:hypothetical protein
MVCASDLTPSFVVERSCTRKEVFHHDQLTTGDTGDRERADVRGKGLPAGHNLQLDLPEQTLVELRAFLRA